MTTILVLVIVGVIAYFYLQSKSGGNGSVSGNLPGPGTYEFDIVGESKYQEALESICGGRTEDSAELATQAVLVLEDSNPHDNMAVRVDIQGKTVGYLSRKDARNYRKQLQQLGHPGITCSCNAMIVGGWQRSPTDQGHFGVKLDLPVA